MLAQYSQAIVSTRCRDRFHRDGLKKPRFHLTTFFDSQGTLSNARPYPWVGEQKAFITDIDCWDTPNGLYIIANLEAPWSHDINAFYQQQGFVDAHPHNPHLTLVKQATSPDLVPYRHLIGRVIVFNDHQHKTLSADRAQSANNGNTLNKRSEVHE